MDKPRHTTMRTVMYALDTAVILLSLLLAFVLQITLRDYIPILKGLTAFREYAVVAFLSIPIWLTLIPLFRLQTVFEKLWTNREIAFQLIKLHFTGFLCLIVMIFITQTIINRSLVALFMLSTFSLMFAVRAIMTLRLRHDWRTGQGRSRVILVGDLNDEMVSFIKDTESLALPPDIIGRIAPEDTAATPGDDSGPRPLLGTIDHFEQILHDNPADQILFFPPLNSPKKAGTALGICEMQGVPASLSIDLFRPGLSSPQVVSMHEHPFITFEVAPKPPGPIAIKHGSDALISALGLILLSPLFLLVSLAILVFMGRPIFFSQERAGLFGRRFRMHKFRTMVHHAEDTQKNLLEQNEMSGPVFKIDKDPRVTTLGRFLRRSSIDELPQLMNVLAGTMSLVGPRPLPVQEQQKIYDWQRRRLSMKPGITGLWQVSGRNNVDFEDWMKLDLRYIDEWSLKLDAIILLRTVRAVLSKTGAS